MIKKITAASMAAVMLLSMTACNKDEGTAVQETAATTASASEEVTAPAVPTEPFDLEKGVTDAMYSRALLNEGNRARLAAVMKKAQNGEKITVGVIGGSITQGSSATAPENSYARLFHKYWTEKFPDCEIGYVNAGIGGTNSYLGVHRADTQLLSEKPDVVIVEFSVNDTDKVMNKYSYNSLVRKILACENDPAVMLLFTTQENGTSLQDVHKEIGAAYDLPMLSYREAVYPEVAAGTLDWKEISPDNIHPDNEGHSIIGQIVARYLDSVYDELDSIDTSDLSFTAESYTHDYYSEAKILGASEITPLEISGFENKGNSVYPQLFPDNWVTSGEGYLKFEVECSSLGIFHLMQTNGNGGKYEVYVDGERKATIDADFSGGWGNYGEPKKIIMGKEKAKYTIEIKLAEGSAKTELTILGVMVS